jgi:hypothetical protein
MQAASEKKWSRRKLFLFGLMVCASLLLLAELISRLLFVPQIKAYHSTVFIQGNTLQMDDSLLIFRNRPFYLDYQYRFQHNEQGMRSKPGDVWMPQKKPGDYWVFLFGGSSMEGMGSNKDGEWLDITGVTDYAYNETIAHYLQAALQEKMNNRKVTVFNAANTSFTIEQSYWRYQQLQSLYEMDWVVSLDGHNNPALLGKDQTVRTYIKKEWEQNPSKKFPLNILIPLTSRSVFVNKLKQIVFHGRQQTRLGNNKKEDYPRKHYWLNKTKPDLQFRAKDDSLTRAVDAFFWQICEFDSVLTSRKQKHLLLIQPHLIFRDTSAMNETEKAILSYYCNKHNDAAKNSFLRELRLRFPSIINSSHRIRLLTELDSLRTQVFVDYCHFTRPLNQEIAKLIAGYILSDGDQ